MAYCLLYSRHIGQSHKKNRDATADKSVCRIMEVTLQDRCEKISEEYIEGLTIIKLAEEADLRIETVCFYERQGQNQIIGYIPTVV